MISSVGSSGIAGLPFSSFVLHFNIKNLPMAVRKFYRKILGANAEDAFLNKTRNDRNLVGSQSDALNSKHDFVLTSPPGSVPLSVWIDAITSGDLPGSILTYTPEFKRHRLIYTNTAGPALCFLASGEAAFQEYIFLGCAER